MNLNLHVVRQIAESSHLGGDHGENTPGHQASRQETRSVDTICQQPCWDKGDGVQHLYGAKELILDSIIEKLTPDGYRMFMQ